MTKDIFKTSSITLDNKHNELIKKYKNDETVVIPKYREEIQKLKKMLLKNKKKMSNEIIQDKIKILQNKIISLEKDKNEYFLENAKYLFCYFEKKKNINNQDIEENNIEQNINSLNENNSKKNIINSLFNIPNKTNISDHDENNDLDNDNNNNNDNDNDNDNDLEYREDLDEYTFDYFNSFDNKDIIDRYFHNIDNNYINFSKYIYQNDKCKNCKIGEIIYVESEGLCICNKCSISSKYLIENDKPSYKEPPKELCFYAYKRINHLREILAQFQAKESTNIPEYVLDNIKHQIKKERIEVKDLTNKKTKEILKNLGYNKYYEHIPFIKDKLGIKPPVMSSELEETLCNLFIEIQKPYSKYCPKERVNFLNYYFTLYKLCELLNEKKFLPYFPMLKDREKRIEQDQIWKKICDELGWEFIPTP